VAKGIHNIERLLAADPDNPNYRNLLGVAELSRGRRDAARELFAEHGTRNIVYGF
jgi:Flp pilus assembly protein TadD